MPTHWLNTDPTRTYSLRMLYIRAIRRRLRWLDKQLWDLIVVKDAFGLEEDQPFQLSYHNVIRHQYKFLTKPQKIAQFRAWLDKQVNAGVLGVDLPASKDAWTATYVDSAYRKGMMRSYTDVHKAELAVSPAWYGGSKEQFLKSAFLQPEMLSKIEMLYDRAFENMKGLTDTMKGQLGRILADGVAHGKGVRPIVRAMRKSIKTLSRGRAATIARTEIIHAHAEGQLDSYALLGIEEVTAQVEWLTAGDDRVCPDCASLEGEVYKVSEAHGMIPLHPNCRCAWMPYVELAKAKKRRRKRI